MLLSDIMSNIVTDLLSAGGAGGKGVWGRSGEVYEQETVDEKDPNYDEAQVPTAVLTLYIFIIHWSVWNSMITCKIEFNPTRYMVIFEGMVCDPSVLNCIILYVFFLFLFVCVVDKITKMLY